MAGQGDAAGSCRIIAYMSSVTGPHGAGGDGSFDVPGLDGRGIPTVNMEPAEMAIHAFTPGGSVTVTAVGLQILSLSFMPDMPSAEPYPALCPIIEHI